jgi:hypothetical protein
MSTRVRVSKLLLGIGVCAALAVGVREAVASPGARRFCNDPLATGYCNTVEQCRSVCQAAGLSSSLAVCNFSTSCCYCEPGP